MNDCPRTATPAAFAICALCALIMCATVALGCGGESSTAPLADVAPTPDTDVTSFDAEDVPEDPPDTVPVGPDDVDTSPDPIDVITDADADADADIPLTPEEIVCSTCLSSDQCGGPNDLCITFPTGGSYCGVDCRTNPAVCPEGTFCSPLDATGEEAQCVPDELLCENPCDDVTCGEGRVCDPLNEGRCIVPRELCERCTSSAQCGGDDDVCITFQDVDRSMACGIDCSTGANVCPDEHVCVDVQIGSRALRQCVPRIATCVDRCSGTSCRDGQFCDPLDGSCRTPGAPCASCTQDVHCGGPEDRCVGLPGPPCASQADCGFGEACSPTGECVAGHCAVSCADGAPCPDGFACFSVGDGLEQCLPRDLACVDRCSGVTCDDNESCDRVTGRCVRADLGACAIPCDADARCGGPDDICLNIGTGRFCALACTNETPCPIGYQCLSVFDSDRFCVPLTTDLSCGPCATERCPSGLVCDPPTGACLAPPTPCDFVNDTCARGEACNFFEQRCEPVGRACTFETRSNDCDISTFRCTAPAAGTSGTCERACFSDAGCPDEAPRCLRAHGVTGGYCARSDVRGNDTCTRLADSALQVGRPCVVGADPAGPGSCPAATATLCVDPQDDALGPFCTRACDDDDDCAGDALACADLGGERYCVPRGCPCLRDPEIADGETDLVGDALTLVGLTRCGVVQPLERRRAVIPASLSDDAWASTVATPVLADPAQALTLLDNPIATLVAARDEGAYAAPAVRLAAAAWGMEPTPWTLPEASDDDVDTLLDAIDALLIAADVAALDEGARDQLEALPAPLRVAMADLVLALADVTALHASALRPPAGLGDLAFGTLHAAFYAGELGADPNDVALASFLSSRVTRQAIVDGAWILAAAIDRFPRDLETDLNDVSLDLSTALGRIVVGGIGDDHYGPEDDDIILLIELGGDDTYRFAAGANRSADHAFGVVIDMGGADDYGYVEVPVADDTDLLPSDGAGRAAPVLGGDGAVSRSNIARQGAGRFGFGALVDRGEGVDTFRSLRLSQGFGMAGGGILVHEGSAATFELEALGQGVGLFGIGVAVTSDHPATWRGVHLVQGAAGPGGAGLLVGGTNNDSYLADPGDVEAGTVIYRSPLPSPPFNFSVAQGAARGFADGLGPGGVPYGGGTGLLVDLGGDDIYEAGVLAMGASTWYGAGIIHDLGGDDIYRAAGIAMGAGFQSGLGVARDDGGDDHYGHTSDPEMSLGFGEDFGVGVFVSEAGNDHYRGGFFTAGVGLLNGTGIFIDRAGDDDYTFSSNDTMGSAVLTLEGREPDTNPRRNAGTFGVFIDAGGTDTYARPDLTSPPVGEGRAWVQRSASELGLPVFGVGIDGDGSSAW